MIERKKGKILVIDDEENILEIVRLSLESEGYSVRLITDPTAALEQVATWNPDVVISDIRMPGLDGISLMQAIRKRSPEINVILMTAHASVSTAVEALRGGAFDYLTKPFRISDLRVLIQRALCQKKIEPDLLEKHHMKLPEFVGKSEVIASLLRKVERASLSDSTVLITGESGTGKELIARRLHLLSSRKQRPFISLNCAALPEGLLESELFGYIAGAFTGATHQKKGLFLAADQGTLFLDEISSLPLPLQAKLLRVLQEREVRPLGGEDTIPFDIRLISATNLKLQDAVKKGTFREDLFFRLQVLPLNLPSLRERREDIPDLIMHFVSRLIKKHPQFPLLNISEQAMKELCEYPWPGNVRELEHFIERLCIMSENAEVTRKDVLALMDPDTEQTMPLASTETDLTTPISLDEATAQFERILILRTLKKTKGNKYHAAKLLKLTRQNLQYKLKKFGLNS